MKIFLFTLLFTPYVVFGMQLSFPGSSEKWEGGFTDYPINEENFYELCWGWEDLPTPLYGNEGILYEKGLYLSGINHSDDLFMFARRKIEGLKANTLYALQFVVLIESNVGVGSFGIGGSPGESVVFKVGAANQKPKKVAIEGFYHLSVDKGNQSQAGENAAVIGDLSNILVDPQYPEYKPKQLCTESPLIVKSSPQGAIWIFLGTDSGFEGMTKFYLVEVNLQLEEMAQ